MKRGALLVLLLLVTAPTRAADVTLPEYERVVLENGTVLLLSEKHDVPLVGLRAIVRGGGVTDPADKAGLAALLAKVLQKGAGERGASEFAEAVAGVGGDLSVDADNEGVTIAAEFLSRDTDLLVDLVSDVLLRPALSADELVKEQERAINLIRAAKDGNPNALIPAYANAFLFGEHPYGRPTGGSETSLANIGHSDLLSYYENNFGGDRLIIAVAGDFDLDAMKARLTAEFEGWRPAAAAITEVAVPTVSPAPRVLLVDKPGATQTYFWLGNLGVAFDYPQRAELNLANTVFGGRFTSMLVTELRVKSGLTYSASSSLDRRTLGGSVAIRSFTETSKTVEAIDLAISVLGQLHEHALDEDMLVSARNYIMGQFPPTLETASALARIFAFLEQNGLDHRYVDDYGTRLTVATEESVRRTIAEVYPATDELVFVLIGDADVIREDVAKFGPVTEVSITEPQFQP